MTIQVALQTLGLDTKASEKDVKQAYRDLAKIWHPDRFHNDERLNERTEAQLKLINEAKTVALAYITKYGSFYGVGAEGPRGPSQSQYRKKPDEGPRGPGQARYKAKADEGPRGPGQARYRAKSDGGPNYQEQSRYKAKSEEDPKKKQREEPKKEKAEEPTPKVEETIIIDEGPSFQFGQNTIIVLFILLVLVSFVIMLGSFMGETPMEKMKHYTEQKPVVDPLRKVMAERDAELGISFEDEEVEPEEEPVVAETFLDTFFTLGSDKEWVSAVQGPPLQIKGQLWRYGHSTVDFIDNKVVGWHSSVLNPLSVGMIIHPDSLYPYANFTLGSSKADVIALQGAPSILKGDDWSYGDAKVLFQGDTVISYLNDQSNTLLAPKLTDPEILALISTP